MIKNKWIYLETTKPSAHVNLICFPYAGTGASFYAPWGSAAPEGINVLPVSYPMREKRMQEPMPDSLLQLAEDFVADSEALLQSKPFALYGHCTGSIIAYEAAKRIEQKYGLEPVVLITASSGIPAESSLKELDRTQSDADFALEMAELGLVDRTLAAEPSFVQYFMPMIRADYLLHQEYRVVDDGPVHCPVAAVYGRQDENLSRADAAKWKRYTTSGFTIKELDESHFFTKHESISSIFRLIEQVCKEATEYGVSAV